MKSMIAYVVVLIALGILSTVDLQTSEASDRPAYYSTASLGAAFTTKGSTHAGKTKAQVKREVSMANTKLAVWPERILKVQEHNFLLAQAFAMKSEDFHKDMGKILMKRDDYVVYSPKEESRFDGFVMTANKLPVVVGETDGVLGVVTGNVVIKVKSAEVAGLVANIVKSQIISVNDATKTATLRLPADQDLTEVIHTIRTSSGVESAEFQVLTKGS